MCFGFILMKTLLPILTVFFFSLHLRNANHIEIINQIIIAVSFTYGWLGNPNVNQGQSRRFLLLNHLPSPGAWKEKSELWITKTYCLIVSTFFFYLKSGNWVAEALVCKREWIEVVNNYYYHLLRRVLNVNPLDTKPFYLSVPHLRQFFIFIWFPTANFWLLTVGIVSTVLSTHLSSEGKHSALFGHVSYRLDSPRSSKFTNPSLCFGPNSLHLA